MDDFEIYECKKYEILAYKEIVAWERKRADYFTKVGDNITAPARYLVKKIGKKKFERLEKAVAGVVESLYRVSEITLSRSRFIKRLEKCGIILDDLSELQSCCLKPLDECNYRYQKIHGASAAIQGGIAGMTGEFAAPVDLSAMLVRMFNMIQNIAFCYGFDPDEPLEKEIMLRIIIVALGGIDVKREVLKEICYLRKIEQEQHVGHYTDLVTKKAMERTVKRLGVALFLKLFSRAIPVLSVVVSAHSNYEMMQSSNEAAFMIYRKHFIERKRRLESEASGEYSPEKDECECEI
ncbi:Protein of unknown function. Homolog to OMM_9 MMP. Named HMP6 in GenBank [Desulfamplus magnetovallimortis]|uniref:EcsC family protein n=2 Tax=Desulfamplus magnetovallimortis TaxID=1246637 RepID=L0R592_9BACT|nr:EcsC family protein [Desulfamplus magnetovallimortis]CCO06700.1 Protein of unknown function. Homolog to OMM_9 MMP. Named HMP6 in GenBank [Desulfamplus magnetovallimortis BW-1]SLM32751.1 Protein of unknown function. Homolog to OMM_9 MMP. Named HMP6 in GenBank [Desulfamplus magnetovallimortis]